MTQQNSFLGTDEPALITPSSDEKTMALLSHVLALATWIVGPLIIYLVKKDESQYVTAHAKESLNFQITIAIAAIICSALVFIIIGIFLLPLLGLVNLVLVVVATIKASEGKFYKYPFTIKFIR